MKANPPLDRLEQLSVPWDAISIVSHNASYLVMIACMAPVRTVHLLGHRVVIPDLEGCSSCF